MKCVKVKPQGAGGCNAGMVTQKTCNRKAFVKRGCNGRVISLCKKCDENFGHVVGPKLMAGDS